MPTLTNWSTVIANPYQAPEVGCNIRLAGIISGDSRFDDHEYVETSRVASSIGRIVETRSGTFYTLEGDPDPEWLDYLKSIGHELDIENPIKQVTMD
jgi:hypothetical protein